VPIYKCHKAPLPSQTYMSSVVFKMFSTALVFAGHVGWLGSVVVRASD